MKMIQDDERTFTCILSDAELEDLTEYAKSREYTPLEIMKAVFFHSLVQIVSCFWRRAILNKPKEQEKKEPETHKDEHCSL